MSKKIRLYIEESISLGKKIYLNQEQKHYLLNVMRCKNGDQVTIFNDSQWIGEIHVEKNPYVMAIEKVRDNELDSRAKLILAFAPTKKYGEFVVEKGTELGVDCIIPIITDRSVVDKINFQKYRKTMIEATEQCGRIGLPNLSNMIDLRDLKKRVRELYSDEDPLFIACDLNNNDYDLNDQLKLSKVICVIVGPEGGFSSRDYQEFNNLSVKYLNLGRNTLRAETASIASLALITAQLRLK